jgi:hypothetical protein
MAGFDLSWLQCRSGSNAPEADIGIAPESGRSGGQANGGFRPEADIGDRHRPLVDVPLVDALAWHE